MNAFQKLTLLIVGLTVLMLVCISFEKLPNIELPTFAHHNTIGELPFVEVMDDGDFYERDGDEGLTAQNCNNRISDECEYLCKKKVFKSEMCSARCYLGNLYKCDDLKEKQSQASLAAGNYTARWMNFIHEKCGSWFCGGNLEAMDKYGKEWDEKMKKEWKDNDKEDKSLWGNRGYVN